MIYINQDQLKQLEALLTQSTNGIHLLFDRKTLTDILQHPTEAMEFFTIENINRVQNILGEFLKRQKFDDKRQYLFSLDKESYELLVRSYFNIVENTILETTKLRH